MQLITLEKSQTTKLFWLIIGLLMAVAVVTAEQTDPGVTATGGLLALTAVLPLYLWLLGSSHGLPIWPVFSLVTGVTYALPMIQDSESLSDYTPTDVIVGGITTIGFILLGTIIWLSMTSRAPKAPRNVLMIEQRHSVRYLLIFVGLGLLFGINQLTGWVRFPGNSMQVVRGITGSLSTMGLFVLAYYQGRGLLSKRDVVLFAAGAVGTMLMNMTSLMLAQAIVPVAMVVFGYMLGSNQLPWRVLLVAFVMMGLLHPGKYEMRRVYWAGEDSKPVTLTTVPQFYWDWFSYGFEEVGSVTGIVSGPKEDDSPTSIFERSGNLHMLLLVQKKTPDEVPYFNGATYTPIPRLLIPRFIDDAKGISHAGNVMLTVNYGLQTLEQTRSTSIGWGLLPEAYANFGYIGIAGLAIVLAIFYALITNLTVGVPMTSLRFVLGLLIMAAATRADTMGVFVTTQFQGVVGVSLAAMVLMRRQANPFAAEGGEGRRHTAGGIRQEVRGKWGRVGEANRLKAQKTKRPFEDGMPAPRVLTGLIEGAPEGRADESVRDQESKRLRAERRETARGVAEGKPKDEGLEAAGTRDVGTGGTVRTLPIRTPKRIASWMPRRVRAAVTAQQLAAQADGIRLEANGGEGEGLRDEETKRPKDERERPRQVAVPYRNYRRYRA
jgi:hypothetical protein